MKKYIVLDSNIFVSFFEGGFSLAQQKGIFSSPEEIIILEHLLKALGQNKAELILPEVVILECERIKEEKKEELDKLFNEAFKGVEEATIPNKIIAIKSREKIKKIIEKICAEEKEKVERAWKVLKEIRKHKNTHVIVLDNGILLSAYKRGLSGKKPFTMRHSNSKNADFNNKPLHDIQPDCIIVESIKYFLNNKKNFELYLGTNDSNFFTSNEKQKIHPDIQTELKIKNFYLTLSDLLNKNFGIKTSKKKIENNNEKSLNAFPLVIKNSTDEGKGEDNPNVTKG